MSPTRGWRKGKAPIGDPADAHGFWAWMLRYLEDLRLKNRSEGTVTHRETNLCLFFLWCTERGLTGPGEVTRAVLQRYQRYLFHFRKPSGDPLTFRTQHARLGALRAYFKWLARKNAILYNPASELDLPVLEKRLPRHVLTASEAEAVLALPDLDTPLGVRDRALLETLYSTGMRRMEVAGLGLFDIDLPRGTVTVRQGKGKKDRVVPIGERALAWVEKYVQEVRPRYAVEPDPGVVFLTEEGESITLPRLTQMVRDYVDRAELGKRGSCHLWRHTCATLMLENGADVRFLQEMLGHAELSTTQRYTQVSIQKLKEVHTATHPSSRLERAGRKAGSSAPALGSPPGESLLAEDEPEEGD